MRFQKDKARRERREAKKAAEAASAAMTVEDEDNEPVVQLRSQAAHSRRPLRRFFFPASSKSDASPSQLQVRERE